MGTYEYLDQYESGTPKVERMRKARRTPDEDIRRTKAAKQKRGRRQQRNLKRQNQE